MASLNKVIIMGNLTKDPEVRYTPSGTAVGDLRMAINRKYKTADGQDKDDTCFVSVTVWGRQAETCAEYLAKGSPVLVEGRLKFDEWEKDGQKFSKLGVVGEHVTFLGSGQETTAEDGWPEAAKPKTDEAPPIPPPPSAVDDQDCPF